MREAVEITEDLLVDSLDRTRRVLDKRRAHGIRVAIDDFECGYSALSYLRDLPIDEVKLDRQFITPMLSDRRAATIVRAVIDLSHDLGVTTVAGGVETSKPVGVADIIDLIRGVKLCCAANTAGCCGSCTRGGVTA